MKRTPKLMVPILFAVIVLTLMAVQSGVGLAQTDTPLPPTAELEPEETKPPEDRPTLTPEFIPTTTPTPTTSRVEIVGDEGDQPPAAGQLFTLEGPLTRWVSDLSTRMGWDQIYFLGLSVEDWINVALSIIFFFLIYYAGKWLAFRGLRGIVKRTDVKFDDQLLDALKPYLGWLMLALGLQLSLARLTFLSTKLRILLNQAIFIAYLTIITVILWHLITLGSEVLLRRNRTEEDVIRLRPIWIVVTRLAHALLLVGFFSIGFSFFGIDITAFAAALGIGGLAISLAAQDTLADAIAGFLILIDQPFRVGDRIEISGLGTWGDVVEIGARSTRIRTRDNRLVIVPNSAIAKDQVVNYTYPDPRYRVQIELGIDYGTDLKRAREIAIETVRDIEGVLPDRPVDALFVDFGDTAITFRIRWWIDSYVDTRRMFDRVNEALLRAFTEAKINMPNITYDINLKVDNQIIEQLSPTTHTDPPERPTDKPLEGE
jgi:small-conductance mechanosensitive channel